MNQKRKKINKKTNEIIFKDSIEFTKSKNDSSSLSQKSCLLNTLEYGINLVISFSNAEPQEIDFHASLSLKSFVINKFKAHIGPVCNILIHVLWKYDPFLSSPLSISPNILLKSDGFVT